MSRDSRIFRISGRFQPYTRMTQRSKHADPRAAAYLASQERICCELRQQMARRGYEMIPRGVPLGVIIEVNWLDHRCDLDNLAKALLDAAQGVVFEDDRWVDRIDAVRNARGNDDAWIDVWPLNVKSITPNALQTTLSSDCYAGILELVEQAQAENWPFSLLISRIENCDGYRHKEGGT